jgi:hypothetical protein
MKELFTATTVVNRYEHYGIVYRDVKFHWFVFRQQALQVSADILPPLNESEDDDYRQTFINECFTAEELALFRSWHREHLGRDATVKTVQFPIVEDIAGFDMVGAGGSTEIIDYSQADDYDLPFCLSAYYDVSGCTIATGDVADAMFATAKSLADGWSSDGWNTDGIQVKADCNEFYHAIETLSTIIGDDIRDCILDGKVELTHAEVVTLAERATLAPEAFKDLADIFRVGNTQLLKCLVYGDD